MKTKLSKRSDALLLVDLGEQSPRYLVATAGGERLKILAKGRLERDQDSTLAMQLREELDKASIVCTRAAVLLTRPTLETVSGSLPPASDDELPDLVASLVTQETDDGADRVIDFLVTGGEQPDSSIDVLAVVCDRQVIESTQDEFTKAGFALEAVTYCGLGSIELLRKVVPHTLPVVIAISSTETKTELVVLRDQSPLLFRTIQRGSDLGDTYGSVLAAELQRTLAYVGASEEDEEDSAQTYLIGRKEPLREAADVISDTLSCSVSIIDVTDRVEQPDEDSSADLDGYANLIGVALTIENDGLQLDFLDPRRPPIAPSPWRRIAVWSGIAAAVMAVFGFVGWSDRADQLDIIETKKASLQKFAGRANKAQELQDIVDTVATWQQSDIVWLDELKELSDRFPQRSESLVRRLSAQAGSNGTGVVDLSVQVTSPEVVTELESAIRDERCSVSSKRVSEVGDSEELNWSFETHVVFRPLAKPLLVLDDETSDEVLNDPESTNDTGVQASPANEEATP